MLHLISLLSEVVSNVRNQHSITIVSLHVHLDHMEKYFVNIKIIQTISLQNFSGNRIVINKAHFLY